MYLHKSLCCLCRLLLKLLNLSLTTSRHSRSCLRCLDITRNSLFFLSVKMSSGTNVCSDPEDILYIVLFSYLYILQLCVVISTNSPLRPCRKQFPRVMPLSKPGKQTLSWSYLSRFAKFTYITQSLYSSAYKSRHLSFMLLGVISGLWRLSGPGEIAGADPIPGPRCIQWVAGGLAVRPRSVCRWLSCFLPTGSKRASSVASSTHLYLFSY